MDGEGRGLHLRAWHKASLHLVALAAPIPGFLLHLDERVVGGFPPGDFLVLALLAVWSALVLLALHQPKAWPDWVGLTFLGAWSLVVALAAYGSCWASGFGGEECTAFGG